MLINQDLEILFYVQWGLECKSAKKSDIDGISRAQTVDLCKNLVPFSKTGVFRG